MQYEVHPIEGASEPPSATWGISDVANSIENAYTRAYKQGGRVVAAHNLAVETVRRPDGEMTPVRADFLFLVLELPDDAAPLDSDKAW